MRIYVKTGREDKQIPLFTISPFYWKINLLTKPALPIYPPAHPSPNILSDFQSYQACPIVSSTRIGSPDQPIQV